MSRVRIKDASKLIVTLPSIGKPRLGSTLPRRAGDSSQSPTQWQPKFNLQAISSSLRYKKPSLPGFAKTMAASLGQQKPSSPNPQTLPESEWDFNRQQNDRGGFSINPADINPLAKVAESPEDLMLAKDYVRYGSAEFQAKQHKAQILVDNFAFPLGPNQLYTPYDLSMDAWRQRQKVKYAAFAETQDPFDRIGVDPYWEYKNYQLLSSFVSSMGRILPMNRTGCSSRNQRRLSKAIRRARALGFMPIWSRHPQRMVRETYSGGDTVEISAERDTFSAAAGRDYANQVEGSGLLKQY